MTPSRIIMQMVGIIADGALAKAAMPAGKEKPPDPIIFLTRFKISFPIVAVPLVSFQASCSKMQPLDK